MNGESRATTLLQTSKFDHDVVVVGFRKMNCLY